MDLIKERSNPIFRCLFLITTKLATDLESEYRFAKEKGAFPRPVARGELLLRPLRRDYAADFCSPLTVGAADSSRFEGYAIRE